jgi:membrane fusion protein (multidrug efflux system)
VKKVCVVAALSALMVSGGAVAPFAQEASVLVKTELPQQGEMPDLVTAFGTLGPAVDGGMTLSVQHEGRVLELSVMAGQQVHKGDKLVTFGASAAVASSYEQALNALKLARSQKLHADQLLSQQLATRDQVAQADKAVLDAQTALDALQKQGAAQPVEVLTAPFDGVATAILVAQGDRVQPGITLLVVTRADGFVVTAGVGPADQSRVRTGQLAHLVRLQGGAAIDGRVLRVGRALNPKTRLVDVDLAVPVDAAVSGEAFKASIQVGQLKGWKVPRASVLVDEKGPYIFQLAGTKAVRVGVKILGSSATTDILEGPLDAGRKLVVEGSNQLTDGAAVRESNASAAPTKNQ